MKKHYLFLFLLLIIVYILYLIGSFTYKEYKIHSSIEYVKELITDITNSNQKALEIIRYKKSKAYKNLILKEQQAYKNKAEIVITLTTEQKYNKFTKEPLQIDEQIKLENKITKITDSMTIYEKWMYFIFKKDIR